MTSAAEERSLSEGDLDADPMRQFGLWFQEAIDSGEPMPAAVAFATVDLQGLPTVRMMLLEHFDARGFILQTNLGSPKAHHLGRVPRGALTFFWPLLVRQVRVAGAVAPISRDEMARYFSEAPAGRQAMLRACHQSEVIASREALERVYAEALASGDTGLPDHWGGYVLQPDSVEFFQARANWLQDRLRYAREPSGAWRIERLVP